MQNQSISDLEDRKDKKRKDWAKTSTRCVQRQKGRMRIDRMGSGTSDPDKGWQSICNCRHLNNGKYEKTKNQAQQDPSKKKREINKGDKRATMP